MGHNGNETPLADLMDRVGVVRTWKRDGTRNLMRLAAAAGNLAQHRGGAEEKFAVALLAGHRLETPLATFRLKGLD